MIREDKVLDLDFLIFVISLIQLKLEKMKMFNHFWAWAGAWATVLFLVKWFFFLILFIES